MPIQKTQIFFVHGGDTFKNKTKYLHSLKTRKISVPYRVKWHTAFLDKKLGADFDIIRPRMPLQDNAKYRDWALHFKRHFPHLKDDLILIGVSLGGIFLAKYLSENKFPKKILATYLVCPPFDNTLPNYDLVGGFKLPRDLSLLEKNSPKLHLLFSKNDGFVPPSNAEKYAAKLKNANIVVYPHIKGHFEISEFPEIVALIRKDTRKL